MATTQIAHVIVPEVFAPYVSERTAEKINFSLSGIIYTDETFQARALAGGKLIHVPFWQDLSGDSELSNDDPADGATPDRITASEVVSRKQFRNKSWSTANLAGTLAGDDPMKAIGEKVSDYWAREWQKILIKSCSGVFDAANFSDHVLDVAIEDGVNATAANKIGATTVLRGIQQALGDSMEDLAGIAMHSAVFLTLQTNNLIDFIEDSVAKIQIPTYLGKRVIVDDGMPKVAGGTSGYKYSTYLFGFSSIGTADGAPKIPVAVDVDQSGGNGEGIEYLYTRQHKIIHPVGFEWLEYSVAAKTPSNAELALGTNWTRKYESKNIKLVELITNG